MISTEFQLARTQICWYAPKDIRLLAGSHPAIKLRKNTHSANTFRKTPKFGKRSFAETFIFVKFVCGKHIFGKHSFSENISLETTFPENKHFRKTNGFWNLACIFVKQLLRNNNNVYFRKCTFPEHKHVRISWTPFFSVASVLFIFSENITCLDFFLEIGKTGPLAKISKAEANSKQLDWPPNQESRWGEDWGT